MSVWSPASFLASCQDPFSWTVRLDGSRPQKGSDPLIFEHPCGASLLGSYVGERSPLSWGDSRLFDPQQFLGCKAQVSVGLPFTDTVLDLKAPSLLIQSLPVAPFLNAFERYLPLVLQTQRAWTRLLWLCFHPKGQEHRQARIDQALGVLLSACPTLPAGPYTFVGYGENLGIDGDRKPGGLDIDQKTWAIFHALIQPAMIRLNIDPALTEHDDWRDSGPALWDYTWRTTLHVPVSSHARLAIMRQKDPVFAWPD